MLQPWNRQMVVATERNTLQLTGGTDTGMVKNQSVSGQ
jgi:hypothetical protein